LPSAEKYLFGETRVSLLEGRGKATVKSLWRLVACRPGRVALAFALLLPAVGCAPSKGAVFGKVTYKGEPLPGGQVRFESPDGVGGNSANINPKDGTYRIEGLAQKHMQVAVIPYQEPYIPPQAKLGPPPGAPEVPGGGPGFGPKAAAEASGAKSVPIPSKYQSAAQSGIECDVKGGSQEFNIDLKEE
jgi:hypothetical protein